jgi:hypothetical protein
VTTSGAGSDRAAWHLTKAINMTHSAHVWWDLAKDPDNEYRKERLMGFGAGAIGRAYGHQFRAAELAYDAGLASAAGTPVVPVTFSKGDVVWYIADESGKKRYGQINGRKPKGEKPYLWVKWLDGKGQITLDLLLKDLALNDLQLFKG